MPGLEGSPKDEARMAGEEKRHRGVVIQHSVGEFGLGRDHRRRVLHVYVPQGEE